MLYAPAYEQRNEQLQLTQLEERSEQKSTTFKWHGRFGQPTLNRQSNTKKSDLCKRSEELLG